ncbi:MAG TPA: thioredoxin family protein [Fimbriimonadaceae bacterium]|nr:thioredoxin family protein [Fimbriimonadaceae bacterium]
MRALRLLGLFALATTAFAAGTPPSAESLLKAAEIKAGHEHKNVFLVFHASWCGWCHKLDDLMTGAEFKHAFDKSYVIVHVTILENEPAQKLNENPGGKELYTSLGGGDGIPFFAIFNPKGTKLGDSNAPKNIGYPAEPNEVVHFMDLMQKTSHMTAQEQAALRAYLSQKPTSGH